MKKFATSAIVADLDNLAELFQNAGTELGIPQRIAMDFAYRCDLLSDAIEKLAGDEEAEEEEAEEAEEEEAQEEESSKKATLRELQTLINRLAGDEEAEEEEAEEEEAELEKKAFRALSALKKLAEEEEAEEAEEAEEEEAEEEEASSKKAREIAKRQALATLLRIAEEEEAEEEEAEEEADKKASGEEKELGQQDDQTIEKDQDEPYMDGFKEGWKEVKEKTGKSASKYRKRFSK